VGWKYWKCFFSSLKHFLSFSIPSQCYTLTQNDIKAHGGYSLLSKHFNASPSELIISMEPEHLFLPWKFTISPHGTWKNYSNHIRFFEYIQKQLAISKPSDWYQHLSQSLIYDMGGYGMLYNHYNASPINFLRKMIPDHKWDLWRMKYTPRGLWNSVSSRIRYFDWLSEELNIFMPEMLYSLRQEDVLKNNGKWMLEKCFGGSVQRFVMEMRVELKIGRAHV